VLFFCVFCFDFGSTRWLDKVHPKLLETLVADGTATYIILLEDAKLNTENVIPTDRPRVAFETLTEWATKTQAPFITKLRSANVEFKPYWIANMIVTTTNLSVAIDVASMENVQILELNKEFKVPLETPEFIDENPISQKRQGETIEWNVGWVGAPTVWNIYGFRGDGFVIANADTGVAWQHPALIEQYRGYNNNNPNHNYNWWDAIHSGGGRCGFSSNAPCDDNGHGTHTTGTAVGFDHDGYYPGVAPGAKWIACRNMNQGFGTPQTYIECLQFFVAPHDLQGNNPNSNLAPHVIGNSYGCPPNEGCSTSSLAQAVTNVVNAGIFMSVSAGNAGPSCSSVNDPPAIYDNVCAVGATGFSTSTIASYSSRGPVTIDGSGIMSPNLVAPGSSVRSAYPPSGYATLSGTSMASPAVTGSIALIWQAKPSYVREPLLTRTLLQSSATPISVTACSSSGSPNNVYGYGELDVAAACSP